jgi:hypothetical protein
MPKIWKPRLNPALHRHPDEAAIIGRIVVGFGELEYLLVVCAGRAIDNRDRIIKALYRLKTTSSRIDAADALIRPVFLGHVLEQDYATMMEAISCCLKIRNQYAHCNWADEPNGGPLFFTDLQSSADTNSPDIEHNWRHIDVALLEAQEEYFVFAQSYLYFFEYALSVIQGKPIYPSPPKPSELARPPMHNPPEKHVPLWLSEDQKALHIARALAAQGGAPTPTRAQQLLDAARADKKAKIEENIRKAREGDARAKGRSNPPSETPE